MEEKRKCIYGFVENSAGNRQPPRPSGRWEDSVKMYLKEIGREFVDWIREAQKRRPVVRIGYRTSGFRANFGAVIFSIKFLPAVLAV